MSEARYTVTVGGDGWLVVRDREDWGAEWTFEDVAKFERFVNARYDYAREMGARADDFRAALESFKAASPIRPDTGETTRHGA